MHRCAIILLAAGASTRMGTAKQAIDFNGELLLPRAIHTALAAKCRPVIVVLGANADLLLPLIPKQGVEIALNPHWAGGMGTSIRSGIRNLRGQSLEAAMILLCDQPLITAARLDQMIESFFASGQSICAARYGGGLGTPAIFSSSHFDELLQLGDAQGGKAVLQRHPEKVHAFDFPEAAVDLDTPGDVVQLRNASRDVS